LAGLFRLEWHDLRYGFPALGDNDADPRGIDLVDETETGLFELTCRDGPDA
jgi:hypothetical protein